MIYDTKQLLNKLRNRDISNESAFEVLKALCALANKSQDNYEPIVQELVLRALDQQDSFDPYGEILAGLVRKLGLYPYLSIEHLSMQDAVAREFHRPANIALHDQLRQEPNTIQETEEGLVFHRVQAEIFRKILDGENVVLSAPTSFGKSSIVDALIESRRFGNIVIVVPTIALIDETRRRLSRFRLTHKIITHASQALSEQNIFIFTQERVVDYPEFPNLDLFVLDEFYKLNPIADPERAATLNHAFYRLTKKAKQFYLLGPNIQEIPNGFPERFRCQFVTTQPQQKRI